MLKPLVYKDLMNTMIAIREEFWSVLYSNLINRSGITQELRQHLSNTNDSIQHIITELNFNHNIMIAYEDEHYKDKKGVI